jgi:hypothetical protein
MPDLLGRVVTNQVLVGKNIGEPMINFENIIQLEFVLEISLKMGVKTIIVIQLPWQGRYHIIHMYRYIDDTLQYHILPSDGPIF